MKETITCVKISVVIPTHNRPENLTESLKSIAKQSLLPAEVIVVDDGSLPAVEEKIFANFPSTVNCVLLRNNTSKGGNNARNQGIMVANGNYIAFLDDDDQFKPNKIEVLTEEIIANLKADIFYHPAHIHMVNENVSYITKLYKFKSTDDIFKALLVQNRIGGTPMVTIRKQALLDVGLFDEEMPALQDYDLWLRMAKNGYKFHLIDSPLTNCKYTTNKLSVSKSIDVNAKAIRIIERKYEGEYNKLNKAEIKMYECWKKKMVIHKSLLNGQSKKAFKYQLQLLIFAPSIVNLASLFIILLGPSAVFKLKARLG